ncbi:hypothetical protein AWW67_00430 [Roseivirga seohaensis]|uniref:6-bladed beta-propeller n=1 Tax=Roseivirga seohaensis TaxID=1914963 RepID=A0A150Y416_9BACT|nr:6-bladed beta-propeller [Roseivirga seohaensis]KYG85740.1 hypothetical protein AWW67_00430 [Roseivirga seohaensis]
MKYTIYVFAISVLLSSCSGGQESHSSKETNIPSDDFKSIPINLDAVEVKLASAIEAVEIMQLEEGSDGFMSIIYKLSESAEHYVIVDSKEPNIFRYNKKGKFEGAFNHNGNGPEEYQGITDIWQEGDHIVVYSSANNRVLNYDHEGNFISSFKMEYPYTNVFPQKNGYVANLNTDDLDGRLVFLDENFKRRSTALPHFARQDFMQMTFNTFNEYKEGADYRTVLSDTIFMIEGDQARPLIKLDYGDNWLWKDPALLGDYEKAMGLLNTTEKVWMLWSHLVGERYLYLMSELGFRGGALRSIVDRETGAQFTLNISKAETEFYTFTPIKWEGDRLLASMASYDAVEIIEKLAPGQVEYRTRTTLEGLESNENPVLMWVKFKDFN